MRSQSRWRGLRTGNRWMLCYYHRVPWSMTAIAMWTSLCLETCWDNFHGVCLWHLEQNIVRNLGSRLGDRFDLFMDSFWHEDFRLVWQIDFSSPLPDYVSNLSSSVLLRLKLIFTNFCDHQISLMATAALPIIASSPEADISLPADVYFQAVNPLSRIRPKSLRI